MINQELEDYLNSNLSNIIKRIIKEINQEYEDYNTPQIVDIILSGKATKSTVVNLKVFKSNELFLNFNINAFGGMIRWVPAPGCALKGSDIHFCLSSPDIDNPIEVVDLCVLYKLRGETRSMNIWI